MLENKASLKIVVGTRSYELICNSDSPLGELYDSICEMRGYVFDQIQKVEQNLRKEKSNKNVEEQTDVPKPDIVYFNEEEHGQ